MRQVGDKERFNWRAFENRVKHDSLHQNITVVKVPESVRLIQGKVIYQKTEFDFCAGVDGIAAFFDCKCMSGNVFNFKSYVLRDKKIHQWNNLLSSHQRLGIAGYLIYFYEHRKIVWASVKTVESAMNRGENSINLITPGLVIQSDDVPVNLRELMRHDRDLIVKALR